jgi:DNA-binding transcriptional regulator YiaG
MSATKKSAKTLSKAQSEKLESLATTSGKIRFLDSEGLSRGDIARVLNIRYQWVRNVLITPLKSA